MNISAECILQRIEVLNFLLEQDLEKLRHSRWFIENTMAVCHDYGSTPVECAILMNIASKLVAGLADYGFDHDGDGGMIIVPRIPAPLTAHQLELVPYSFGPEKIHPKWRMPQLQGPETTLRVKAMFANGTFKARG